MNPRDQFRFPSRNSWESMLACGNALKGVTRNSGSGRRINAQMSEVPFDVWGGVPPFYTWPVDSEMLEIVSTSADDSVGGAGAQTVQVRGVDGSKHKVLTVDLKGTTPVPLREGFRHVNQLNVSSSGAARKAIGSIICRRVSDGIERSRIGPTEWTSRQPMMRVPDDMHLILLSIITNISAVPAQVQELDYTIEVFSRPIVSVAPPLSVTIVPGSGLVPPLSLDYPVPLATLPAGSDFSLVCTRLTANGPTIFAAWSGLLVNTRFFD